jgi:hypothetical protein
LTPGISFATLNIHLSESVVRLVARHCGLDGDLGIKGKSGVLASKQPTKHFFMAQSDRNLVFHSGTKAYPPRQLRQQANVEDQDLSGSSLISTPPWPGPSVGPTQEASRRIA